MPTLFADSGFWIALVNDRDELHNRALAALNRFETAEIVTTEMVLVEVANHLGRRGRGRRRDAADLLHRLEEDSRVEIVQASHSQYRQALQRYAERPDQSWSLTDCASFLVMEERGIADALAYDRDFEQAGFAALLRG